MSYSTIAIIYNPNITGSSERLAKAFAKKVQMKGSVNVTSSPLNSSVRKNATTEMKKRIQLRADCFMVFSIFKNYAKLIQ